MPAAASGDGAGAGAPGGRAAWAPGPVPTILASLAVWYCDSALWNALHCVFPASCAWDWLDHSPCKAQPQHRMSEERAVERRLGHWAGVLQCGGMWLVFYRMHRAWHTFFPVAECEEQGEMKVEGRGATCSRTVKNL